MTENRKTPKLRFKGFTDAWEQRKLGEVLRTIPFKPFLKIPEQGGKYEIIQQGNEPIIGYANGEPCEDFRNTVIFGDHTLSLYKPKQPFFVATDGVRILQGTNDMYGYYLLSLLEGNSPQSEGYKRYYSILADREVLFTENHYEQVKIGLYFKNLDNLITLHQHKLDRLKNIKKSMLDKMFPKDGEVVPEIRFKGFTDAWEQRKLGEFTISYSGGTPSVGIKEYYNGQIPFIRSAEINSEITELFLTEEGLKNSSARLVDVGDILYALYGATSGEVGRARLKGAVNQAILVIKPHKEYDSEFLTNWLRKSKESIVETYLQGGQGNLSGTIVKELLVCLPSHTEQEEIGSFFYNLDNLITLHQRKLDKLKNIKKSMLDNMFV